MKHLEDLRYGKEYSKYDSQVNILITTKKTNTFNLNYFLAYHKKPNVRSLSYSKT